MMNSPNIHSFERVVPMIYAYTHPDVPAHQGWSKIGYTEKQSVHDRIEQQNHTSDIPWELLWQDNAMYKDGTGQYFTDHDFHRYFGVVSCRRATVPNPVRPVLRTAAGRHGIRL